MQQVGHREDVPTLVSYDKRKRVKAPLDSDDCSPNMPAVKTALEFALDTGGLDHQARL